MPAPRLISIIGQKNAGKTTLAVALVAELIRRGHRVGSIKHGHHPAEVDKVGSDTWRQFHEARAERVLIQGPETRVLFERAADDYDPFALVRRHFADADIVVLEGYKRAPLAKIEVARKEAGPPLFAPDAPNAGEWVAIVTDLHELRAPCRVLRFNDTMWLQLLAALAWERATPLPG